MIIPGQFGFNCPSGLREEAFWDIFPIGSNVKLSPAVAAILNFISEQKNKSLYRTIQWTFMYSLALIIFVVSEKKAFEHFPIGSCDGGHLRFPIGIKNRNLVKDIPMIIHLQFGFSQFISFREDLWNFSQSEHTIGPGSHVEYPTGTKSINVVEDNPRNIHAKLSSNWSRGFGEEAWNVKSLDDRRQTTDAKWWQ
jgi:hypothetical protein